MINLTGQLLNVVYSEQKDYETGEIKPVNRAEILHQAGGKSVVENLKLQDEVLDAWRKCVGTEITVEIKFGAMSNKQGGKPTTFLSLANPHALPVVLRPVKG